METRTPGQYYCPFCTNHYGTVPQITQHIRGSHKAEWPKWKANPARVEQALQPATTTQQAGTGGTSQRRTRATAKKDARKAPARETHQQGKQLTKEQMLRMTYEQLVSDRAEIRTRIATAETLRGQDEALTNKIRALRPALETFGIQVEQDAENTMALTA